MFTKVTNDVLADDAVTTNNISNAAITTDKIAADAITANVIANGSIDGTKIAIGDDTLGDLMYYNGTAWDILPAGVSGQFLQTQGNVAAPVWQDQAAWGGTESAAANGYVTFPGGIKFQCGVSASISANTTGVVTLPSAFTTEVYSVVATGTGTTNLTTTGTTTISNANVTAFTIENGDDNARTFYWQAVGK